MTTSFKLIFFEQCAVPENIHITPTEGNGISWGEVGGYKTKKFKEMYEV